MDLQSQEKISELAELHGPENLVVILGAPDPESAEIAAETVVLGDPAYAGALAEAQLGLDVYHILDDEISQAVPDDVWDDQIGVMADVLEADELVSAVAGIRAQSPRSPAD
jgi:betaine reductase